MYQIKQQKTYGNWYNDDTILNITIMLLSLQTQCQFVTIAVNRYENYSNKIKAKIM